MVRSEGYEIKRGAHFRGVPITRGSDLVPLLVKEELVMSAVLKIVSLVRMAVYATEDAPECI
jgi:hypothetical protein